MSFPLRITNTNNVSQNQFTVNLQSSVDLNDFEVSVGSAYLYYSWYNITGQTPLNNNQYQLIVPTSSGSTTFTITIENGAYQISDLNNALQYFLIANGLYITNDATGLNTYYCSFSVSPTSYKVQFNTVNMGTSLPADHTSGGMTYPATPDQSYQLVVLSTNKFTELIGFTAGTYPASATISGTTNTSESDLIPNVSPISAIQMRLNCCYNELS